MRAVLQSACGKIPSSYELVGQKKGFKRYKSPCLVQLLAEYTAAQEAREAALSAILQVCCSVLFDWQCLDGGCWHMR